MKSNHILILFGFVLILLLSTRTGPAVTPAYGAGGWTTHVVDSLGTVGQYPSIAINTTGRPSISYYDSTNGNLKCASWDGIDWDKTIIDDLGDVGRYTCLAIDNLGNNNISYYDVSNGTLKYVGWIVPACTWNLQEVDVPGDVGQYTSIDLDETGFPHISYYDVTNTDLKFGYWNGSAWVTEVVDSPGDVGMFSSLVIGESKYSNRNISYYDATNSALKFAQITTSVEDSDEDNVPKMFTLNQNYPNPFNPQTVIEYTLPKAGIVNLTIYNILGQRAKTLVDEHQVGGSKRIVWDGKDDDGEDLVSGIYFCRLKAGELSDVKKMVLLK